MFPAYGYVTALQQAVCHRERYVQWGTEVGERNIVSLAAFWTMEVSIPKENQEGIKHRGLQAGP